MIDVKETLLIQEANIQNIISSNIDRTPNKLELYYFTYFIIYNHCSNHSLFKSFKGYYVKITFENIVQKKLFNIEENILAQNIDKRYDDYNALWEQIDMGMQDGNSNNLFMFFSFAGNKIFESKGYGVQIGAIFFSIQQSLSEELNLFEKKWINEVNPSVFNKIKSIFKK